METASSPASNISRRLLQLRVDSSLTLVFPGQGSQKAGMGADVRSSSSAAREVFALVDEAIGFALSDLCANGPDDELTSTAKAQPAILTTSLAILAAALESGALASRPAFVAGHSLGEYSALVAAGALSIADAVRLVGERGRLMAEAGRQTDGTLAAVVGLDEATVAEICRESGAEVANYNAPTQTVIGGTPTAVERACALAKEHGGRGLSVNVSGAFHTSLMEPAAREFARVLDPVAISEPAIAIIGNVSAQPMTTVEDVRADLGQQIRSPVRWYQSIDTAQANGVRRVIELGPGRILTSQLKRSHPDLELGSLDEAAALKAASGV
ncbi:MAG TPA: ACP S-malonyltransferase [Dehalococcoidia bacterium]|jgi:[acyl-carrier-protein] S-malonyltransferase